MDSTGVDFALVAWREEMSWTLVPVPEGSSVSLAELEKFARQRQGEAGALAFVSVAEQFFVGMRIQGARTRILLSDVNASFDWPIAEEAAELLEIAVDDEDDLEDGEPVGDLTLLADFGITPVDLDQICADLELYPDEQIAAIAKRAGFASELAPLLDTIQPIN